MRAHDVLIEAAGRPATAAEELLAELPPERLNAHPANHPNSIAWLLWHAARQQDAQLADLSGEPQLWTSRGFADRFGDTAPAEDVGYGHSDEQARAVVVDDAALLGDYLRATTDAVIAYVNELPEPALDDVVDRAWDPPVTRMVRLVSIIDDAAQHVGQAAYAAGTDPVASGAA
ncbi:mycothiol transferase [Propionibacteriaceae bacterium Y2011]|uniref:mycothiol transferase n=1 Tax=Microlunatus sp. Y2014 TaxID=3418488 RepID=UPI003B48D5DC